MAMCDARYNVPGDLELIRMLLDAFPEATHVSSAGSLPLHIALRQHAEPEVVRLVLAAYPRAAHEVDSSGWLPLHLALESSAPTEVISWVRAAYPEAEAVVSAAAASSSIDQMHGFENPMI